jgi:hypothetical protein
VQALARISQAGGEEGLHEGMYILRVIRTGFGQGKTALGGLSPQGFQAALQGLGLTRRDDTGLTQHLRVGQAALDVLKEHPAVHRE